MSALSRFEQFMENMVEGSVARFFRSPVQPAEIAKRLERAMESHQTIGVRRVIVPNVYRAYLNPKDFSAFQPMLTDIEREMATYLSELAGERDFTMLEHPRVQLVEDPAVPSHTIQVVAETVGVQEGRAESTQVMSAAAHLQAPQQTTHHALLLLQTTDGPHPIPIESTTVTLGRGLNNDVILDDTRVSRHHAQLRYKNRRFWLTDLGSTNGTCVNDEQISEVALRDGDTISLGGLLITFREG